MSDQKVDKLDRRLVELILLGQNGYNNPSFVRWPTILVYDYQTCRIKLFQLS